MFCLLIYIEHTLILCCLHCAADEEGTVDKQPSSEKRFWIEWRQSWHWHCAWLERSSTADRQSAAGIVFSSGRYYQTALTAHHWQIHIIKLL